MGFMLTVIAVIIDGVVIGRIAAEPLKKAFGKLPGAVAGIVVGIAYSALCFFIMLNDVGGLVLQLIIVFGPVALFILLDLIVKFSD